MACTECGRERDDLRRGVCFGCRVKTVNLGFSYGREDFHGPTIRERQNEMFAKAAQDGRTLERSPA